MEPMTTVPYNVSIDNESLANSTMTYSSPPPPSTFDFVLVAILVVIILFGLIGNGLVIYVVLRYAKMKTVTNMYILNLAVSDLFFILSLPFLIATSLVRQWVFGYFMCKIYYILMSINWFSSVFTLTVMSADRYMAVCHPIRSMSFRTPVKSRIICVCVWLASMLFLIPVCIYAKLIHTSCTIVLPDEKGVNFQLIFTWYTCLAAFVVPVALISVFYTLVVLRLKTVGPKSKSKDRKKSRKRVTMMVLAVIAIYILCWMPYWLFQLFVVHRSAPAPLWTRKLFHIFTVLTYLNSMLNPILYAFFSENFRTTFWNAFSCASAAEVNRALQAEHSLYPNGRKSIAAQGKAEATSINQKTMVTSLEANLKNEEDDVEEKHDSESELQPVMQENGTNTESKPILDSHTPTAV